MKRLLAILLVLGSVSEIHAIRFRQARGPLYWSGTNCVAGGSNANISAGEVGIYSYEIRLNGEVTHSDPKDGMATGSCAAGIVFDSSHFPNGTNVQVKTFARAMRDDGSIGPWQEDAGYSAVVKNFTLVAPYTVAPTPPPQHSDPHPTPTNVSSLMTGANYSVHMLTGVWSANQYFNSMEGTNTVFFFGHGNKGTPGVTNAPFHISGNYHEDIKPFGWFSPEMGGAWVDGYDDRRPPQLGIGLPPFNSTANPPTNLLWIWSCRAGNGQEFHRCLYPYESAYSGGACKNQTYVGFTTYVAIWNPPTEFALQKLLAGNTILRTRTLLRIANLDGSLGNFVNDEESTPYRPLENEDMPIRGDYYTKLKGVYTGTNDTVTSWWN